MPAQEHVLQRSKAKTVKKEKQFGSHPCVGVSFGTRGKSASRHHNFLALQCFEEEAEDFVEAFRFLSSSFSNLFLSASASAIAMMSSVSGSPAAINFP